METLFIVKELFSSIQQICIGHLYLQNPNVCCGCCILTPLNRLVLLQYLFSPLPSFLHSGIGESKRKKKGYEIGKSHIVSLLNCFVLVNTFENVCWRSPVIQEIATYRCSAKTRAILCIVGNRIYVLLPKTWSRNTCSSEKTLIWQGKCWQGPWEQAALFLGSMVSLELMLK